MAFGVARANLHNASEALTLIQSFIFTSSCPKNYAAPTTTVSLGYAYAVSHKYLIFSHHRTLPLASPNHFAPHHTGRRCESVWTRVSQALLVRHPASRDSAQPGADIQEPHTPRNGLAKSTSTRRTQAPSMRWKDGMWSMQEGSGRWSTMWECQKT
jgi:hypothetical protein